MDKIKSPAIRKAARNQRCTLNIVGVCNHDPSTTVLAHLPDESNGMATKPDDLSSCFACNDCHDVIDGRAPWPVDQAEHAEWYYRRAMVRTWRELIHLGEIQIVDFEPTPIDWAQF